MIFRCFFSKVEILRRHTLTAALLLAGALPALACDTRQVAQAAAKFDSCGTPWEWVRSSDDEDIYLCDNPGCDDETVLRITLNEMSAEDAAMTTADLLDDWTKRIIPPEMGDYKIEMAGDIAVRTIGGHEGVYIPLRLTHKDGEAYTSLAFRVPVESNYLIANATGDTDQTVLRGFLSLAVENIEIED